MTLNAVNENVSHKNPAPPISNSNTDNNDDNEFATGFKEETRNPDHDPKVDTVGRLKEMALHNERLVGKMIEFSHLIERSGKQLESMGQRLYQLGFQVERYFNKNEKQ